MDEARRVLDRLERIDSLRCSGAEAGAIVFELRELVREGQAWIGAEGRGVGSARAALGSLEGALEGRVNALDRPRSTEGVVLTDAGI